MKLAAFLVVFTVFPFAGFAQYYPAPTPIGPERRSELLLKLKNTSAPLYILLRGMPAAAFLYHEFRR